MIAFIVAFVILLFLGLSIAFSMGFSAFVYFIAAGKENLLSVLPQRIFMGVNSFTLIAVPFFLLAGEIMNKSGITERLVELCDLILGRLRGGLAYVNILTSTIFAGISGSAIADIMSTGTIEVKTMTKQGYTPAYSAALSVASSVVGPVIPPSIIAAMYSGITGVSLGALFAAGYAPGIIISLALSILVFFQGKKRNFPRRENKIPLRQAVIILKEGLVAILMPIIMVGGILFGVFTPTEAAIVGVAYALLVSTLVLRTFKLSDLPELIKKTIITSTALLFLIGMACLLGYVLSFENVGQKLANFILNVTNSPQVFLLLVALTCLIAGMWMEVGTIVILLAPILYPAAISMGVNLVHLGVILIVSSVLGVSTPPVGVCLYAASSIAKVPAEEVFKEVLPFLIIQIITIVFFIFFPDIVLFLPRFFKLIT